MNKGKLYGVGVGPGDPELITLKAHRIINENKYIAIPGKTKEETKGYQIAAPQIVHPEEKEVVSCYVEMTKDGELLKKNYDYSAKKIMDILDQGENVVYLTLGDPTIYSTYMYIHQRIEHEGYEVEIVNGIPSFCAAAARLGISLCERSDELHIIPSSYDVDDNLKLSGTKVLMKAAGKLPEIKNKVKILNKQAYMIENCCMESERIYKSVEEFDDKAGFLSVIIVKEQ